MIRVALAQINPIVGDLNGNQSKILSFMSDAKKEEADIVIFPELAICGYPPEDLLHKEHFVEDNLKVLRLIAKKTIGITAVVGFADKNGYLFNAAAVMHNGRIIGVYHKENLPNYGVFDEKRYFEPGKNNKLFSYGKNMIGVNICEDIWLEKGIFQRQAQKGAQLIINISGSPYNVGKLTERENLLKKRAKKSRCHICYVNLVGGQDELVFDGGSLIVDPLGNIVATGNQFQEDLVIADLDIDPSKVKKSSAVLITGKIPKGKVRPIRTNVTTQLSKLERVYSALVLGTRDYIQKNGFKKTLIGLSGGIDSALVAAIAVDAVGKENVVCVPMPSRYSSKGTKDDARLTAKNLGVKFIEIPIEGIFGSYLKALSNQFKNLKSNIAEENIQARIRGNILMALSNKFGWIVLTTGNKSEVAVGYCTLYGDMTGGFAILKDVPKTKVYELAKLRNQKEAIIPESVIKRAPTAELRKNQKDQDSLPAYDELDQMLEDYIEQHSSLKVMTKNGRKGLAKQVIGMVDRSEYKRRQSPPGIKISIRSFDKDWRLPITNKYREF